MRDAAAAAAMSDPDNNRWFRRRWFESSVEQPRDKLAPTPALDFELFGRELLMAWRATRESSR